ncbi:MAG: signal peptidase II [Planctomycetota bacterium]
MKRRLPAVCLAVAVLVADLASKHCIFAWFDSAGIRSGQVSWIFGEWFGLARVMNPGVTGGIGSFLGPVFLSIFTAVASVGIALYLLLPKGHDRWTLVSLALILGGAVGNLYDRVIFGEVRDFIDVWPRLPWPSWLHHWPTFNIADSGIVVGVVMLVVHSLFLAKKTAAHGSEDSSREM